MGAASQSSIAGEAAERAPGPGLGRKEGGSGGTSHVVCCKLINLQGPQDNGGKSGPFRLGMGMTGSQASSIGLGSQKQAFHFSYRLWGTEWRRVFFEGLLSLTR